jgi:hypothetical protein
VKWNNEKTKLIEERVATAAHECGILWLVFALLDRIVQDKLTFLWLFANARGAIAVWSFGIYIELRRR